MGPRIVTDEPPGTCEPKGTACDKYRISREYKFVWHHVWKGGTTSLSPYLSCNMRALPVAGLLRRPPAPLPGYLHVGTAREPIGRFVSAFQEVYARVRLRKKRRANGGGGGGGGGGRPAAGEEGSTPRCWHRRVPWLLVAMSTSGEEPRTSACTDPEDELDPAALRAIVRQFVADVECGVHFPNVEHLYSQTLFLGGNTSVPQPLDLLLRLETLADDLPALKRRVGYTAADACPLKTERAASQKPRAVPHAVSIGLLLRDEPGLLQSVCNVYMQDFVCLGYPLPKGCELLPRAAPQPPATMNITASALRTRVKFVR